MGFAITAFWLWATSRFKVQGVPECTYVHACIPVHVVCMQVCLCVRVWVGVDACYLYYQEYHFDSQASKKVTIFMLQCIILLN